jgi:hypothetical protein
MSSKNAGRGNENGFAQLFRHASTRDADKYIGKPGELTYDSCSKCLIIHNGCTPGGCQRICVAEEDVDDFLVSVTGVGIKETNNVVSLDLNAIWYAFAHTDCNGVLLPISSQIARCSDLHKPATVTGDSVIQVAGNFANQTYAATFNPINAVAAICGTGDARKDLADCLISGDANNIIVQGTDYGLYVSPHTVDINVLDLKYDPLTHVITLRETDGTIHTINMADLVDPPQVIVSTDAGNIIVAGTDLGAKLTSCDVSNAIVSPLAGPLAAEPAVVPPVTDNYGLVKSALPNCPVEVPYASQTRSGVVELLDATIAEASKDHNLGATNNDTSAWTMNDRSLMSDTRVLTNKTAIDWLNNNFWIETNRVFNVPSARFPTLESVYTYLADYRISTNGSVTINLPAGKQTLAAPLTLHPDYTRITLNGVAAAKPALAAFAKTGATNADYATNKALLATAYPTIIDVAAVGTIANANLGIGTVDNIQFINAVTCINHATQQFGNVAFDAGSKAYGLIASAKSEITINGEIVVIGNTGSGNILYATGDASIFVTGRGIVIGSSGNGVSAVFESNITFNNDIVIADCLYGTSASEKSIVNLRGIVDISWCTIGVVPTNQGLVNIVGADANSSFKIHDISVIGVYAHEEGSLLIDNNGTAVLVDIRTCGLYGVYLEDKGAIGFINIKAGSTITANVSAGARVNNDSTLMLAAGMSITGNPSDVVATNVSQILLKGATIGVASPPVGVLGNIQSIIIA